VRKEFEKARHFAEKVVPLSRSLDPADQCRILSWAGEIGVQAQSLDFAEKSFRAARKIRVGLRADQAGRISLKHLPGIPSIGALVLSEGEVLEKQEKWKEAVALYGEASENKTGGNRILYAHARALLKDGGKEAKVAASRSLEKIQQSQDDDVWKKLAKDTLSEIAKEGKVDEKRNP
jgi:predicted Zn-dependent protease